jgi:hypothetical protein
LRNITKFAKRHECTGHFNHNGETLATFTPTTEISIPKPTFVKGKTKIFGYLIEVGGLHPNVHLKISDEQTLIFSASEANIKKLAPKIYDTVALFGVAKWDAKTLRVEDFSLEEILDYSPGNTLRAIEQLRGLTSGFWDKFNTHDDINNQLLRD